MGGLTANMEAFFEEWLSRQRQFLEELTCAPRDNPFLLRILINRVFAHYHAYYHEKARLMARDVLLVFSPAWLNPYEQTFLWITGWKPTMAFCLLRGLEEEAFSPEQREAIEQLRRETGAVERELSEEMARVQEAMAMPQVLGLVRRARDGEMRTEAVEAVIASLEVLAGSADALRARTVTRLGEILSPVQMVDFLAAAAQLHFRIREWGQRRAARAG